ncbi:tryptophan synthase [Aspergillus clavatus NRRL 1]|uniref:tryptophan synthase n=1 Tax=Aspergillus clavatus (strain ATCC 1007 / CBS 513.65 / DSM 816 / NCTC 3887 / NRRL 1 / QM 1276 / 107) TaxID=344612 RepID=A1CUJ3_ASPCL|nr:tryptophan synthase [Aspergillus clavatus NRRL 1]EAW06980.1 tryptophan synthase [Aspergillus clavatus NRRL 1]
MIVPTSFKPSLTRIRSKRRSKKGQDVALHSHCPACLHSLALVQETSSIPRTLSLNHFDFSRPAGFNRSNARGKFIHNSIWKTCPLPSLPVLLAPTRFGTYGGRFAPESQMDALSELTLAFDRIISDCNFWAGYLSCPGIRPSPLRLAENLTRHAGGANIWLKREDLNQHGSHNIRNIVGQALIAHRLGKSEIVMDCGSANHGIACAAICARLKMKCTILMGSWDATCQKEDVERIKQLGASLITVETGSASRSTLRAAVNEALRYAVAHLSTTYHILSGPIGPHPLPTIARTFQSILGEEIKQQFGGGAGSSRVPDALVSPVGPGSTAVGMFHPFIDHPSVKLLGVEAAGAAPLSRGDVGVLHGCRTYLLQNDDGQILDSWSPSPDMNFPSVGPELACWKDMGRVEYATATDDDAVRGVQILRDQEGVDSGLGTGYAVERTMKLARELGPGRDVVLLVTG